MDAASFTFEKINAAMGELEPFCRLGGGLVLRRYQQQVADVLFRSVFEQQGLSLAVMFPRQSGKNELQAQMEAYLLTRFMQTGGEIVKVSPTWRPQSLNAMRRLERVLKHNRVTRLFWRKEQGYIYQVGEARIFFFSGAPEANIVGATASLLLEVDEAQDVTLEKFDRDIAPMAASTNATRIFWGTAWNSQTLLARELRAARAAEQADGRQRAFVLSADEVAREVPEYGRFVAGQVARHGRNHPMVRTQYFSEELDGEVGMFPPVRRAMMQGDHTLLDGPQPGRIYALLLDVAGEDESGGGDEARLQNPRRDSTALTVVEVDLAGLGDALVRLPVYRVVQRQAWVGIKHAALYGQIVALAELWRARHLVVDATGVGAGLASFLARSLGGRVIPFTFSQASKSKLGWDFLSAVDAGRFKEALPAGEGRAAELQRQFWQQVEYCRSEVQPGPARLLRWSVPDGTRDLASGERLHDDLLISAALCTLLDGQTWAAGGGAALVAAGRDPLAEMERRF